VLSHLSHSTSLVLLSNLSKTFTIFNKIFLKA
jgi:hypothetical protein